MVEDASCVGRRLEELGRGSGGIAQLVERRPCNWVVVFAGWMLSLLSGNDSIVYRNRWLTFSQKWGRGLEHAIQDCALYEPLLRTFRGDSPTAYANRIKSVGSGTMGAWLDP